MLPKKFYSACALNCPDICAYIIHVEEGKVVRLEGDENHPYTLGRCCPKGYGHVLRTNSEDRLLYPMRRQVNGSFERISWDDALNEIASRIDEARKTHGPESIGIYSGSGNDGMAPRYAARFCNVLGCRLIPGIVEICFEGAYEGARFNVGPFPPHELSDVINSKCIIIWGTNKFESGIHSKRIIQEALDNGAKLIVIDPRKTPHAKVADVYTTIRPGTDAALALGLANEIIRKDLYDHEFVEKYIVGFEEFKKRVSEYDRKTVSDITWVDMNTIGQIAHAFATYGPSTIFTAPAGMNHYTNGTWTARAVHSLLAVCGYLGMSGGGFQYLSSDNSPFNGEAISLSKLLPASVKPIVPSGTYVPEFVLSQKESPIKVFVVQAGSPMTQWPNTTKVLQAFEKIPFKVCIEQMMTDTAKSCDIVLPATTIFEHHNLVHSEIHRIVQYAPKIVEPRGEARHELEIWGSIAERLGIENKYDTTEIEAIRAALESEDCKEITLESLIEHPEGIRTLSHPIPFANKEFQTPSGKVELYSQQLAELGYDPLPFHEEPLESPISTPERYKDYPLIMITGRLRERLHSQFTAIEVGATVKSYAHCTSCQQCVKDCPDEAITLSAPSPNIIRRIEDEETESTAKMRRELTSLVRNLAVTISDTPLAIPDEITGLLIPVWDPTKCIGCRECELDVCPFDVVVQPIKMVPKKDLQKNRALLRMHPETAKKFELQEGERVCIESVRGKVDGMLLELSEDLDPRIVWSSDGWWTSDGNINMLTDDKHTAFGHTPGFNSVLVKVAKSTLE